MLVCYDKGYKIKVMEGNFSVKFIDYMSWNRWN